MNYPEGYTSGMFLLPPEELEDVEDEETENEENEND